MLEASGSELEREFGFGVARQLFEPVLGTELVPAALGLTGDPAGGRDAQFALIHGLYWLTANLASEEPLLLWIDDLGWVDEPTLRFLGYLGRRIDDLPVLVLVALRSPLAGEERLALDAVVNAAQGDPIRPAPLSASAVEKLASERLGRAPAEGFADALVRATGGLPLLVDESLAELAQRGAPPDERSVAELGTAGLERVAARVAASLDALPEGAAELAEAVAILGDGCYLAPAAELAGIDEPVAGRAAEALIASGVLERGATLRFRHPLVRSVLAGRRPEVTASRAHERAAAILARRNAAPAAIAAQLLRTSPRADPLTVSRLRAAARAALAQGDPALAARELRRARAEPPEPAELPQLLQELAEAELAAGSAQGIETLRELLDLTRGPVEGAAVALRLSRALSDAQRWTEAAAVSRTALTGLGDLDRELSLMHSAVLADAVRMDMGNPGEEGTWIASLAEGLAGQTPGERWVLATAASTRPADSAREHVAAAEALDLLASEPGAVGRPETGVVSNLIRAGELNAAAARVEYAMDEARVAGHLRRHALMLAMRGWIELERGRLPGAEDDLAEAVGLAGEVDLPTGSVAAMLAFVRAERGELALAGAALTEHGLDGRLPATQPMNLALFFRARVRLAQDRPADALADALEVGERYDRLQLRRAVPAWRSLAAGVLGARGEVARARELASDELELAQRWGTPLARGLALRGLGLVEQDAGLLERAIEELATSDARLELARAQVDLGALLRRSGAAVAAREPLRAGMDLAHACGGGALVQRARTELLASGARPRRPALHGSDALTPSELRVARRAAAGLTNREIAQTLFVTTSTVETHLRHAFGKLGVGSREELSAALPPEGEISG